MTDYKEMLKALRSGGAEAIQGARREIELRQTEKDEWKDQERKSVEDRPVLSPQHWIENEFYAGGLTSWPDGSTYPALVDLFVKIFELRIFEIMLKGSSGWGKSSLTRLIEDRCLYLLTCPHKPHRSFLRRMNESDPILMLNMNVTKDKAKTAYFVAFRNIIMGTKYYQEVCPPRKGLLNRLEFPTKNILCGYTGASRTAAESENLVFVALDEIGMYEDIEKSKRSDEGGGRYDEARIVHTSAIRRMQNRFMHPDGSFPAACKLVSLCRETYYDSFMNQRAKEIRDHEWDKPNKHTGFQRSLIVDMAEWESKPKHFYIDPKVPEQGQWFWVKTSTRTEPAQVIVDEGVAADEKKRMEAIADTGEDEKFLPRIMKVPRMGGEYVEAARDNIEGFIRDVCGLPTEAINVFFTDKTVITEARRNPGDEYPWTKYVLAELCKHPFTAESTNFMDGVELVRSRLAEQVAYKGIDGEQLLRWRPLIMPGAPRYIHVDMGLTGDAAGISMVAGIGWKKVRRAVFGVEGGVEMVDMNVPWIWHDFTLQIVPPPDGQIPFSAVFGVVKAMKILGFRIVFFSMDQFQSAMLLQTVHDELGIDTEVVSLDRTPDGYKELRRAYTEHRIATYEHEVLEGELRTLETCQVKKCVGGKETVTEYIDHPPKLKKDCADSMAGAVWDAVRLASEYGKSASGPSPIAPKVESHVEQDHARAYEERDAFLAGRFEDMFDAGDGGDQWE